MDRRPRRKPTQIVPYERSHLEAILALADGVAFSTFVADPDRAHRALSAPGAISLVALVDSEPIGFAHAITDGEIQAYLSMLLVSPTARRQGIGRALVEAALSHSGALGIYLVATEEAQPFYRSLPHRGPLPAYRVHQVDSEGEAVDF